jgi:hypothetical protein
MWQVFGKPTDMAPALLFAPHFTRTKAKQSPRECSVQRHSAGHPNSKILAHEFARKVSLWCNVVGY